MVRKRECLAPTTVIATQWRAYLKGIGVNPENLAADSSAQTPRRGVLRPIDRLPANRGIASRP
jgi:hypothetical protein